MIDDRTQNLNLPLPHKNNLLSDDVERLRETIVEIDQDSKEKSEQLRRIRLNLMLGLDIY